MNYIFALLTVIFCLTCVGSKNQVDFGNAKASIVQEADSDERFQLPLIPIIHQFIFSPTIKIVSTYVAPPFFAFTFHQEIISEVSSRGPPAV